MKRSYDSCLVLTEDAGERRYMRGRTRLNNCKAMVRKRALRFSLAFRFQPPVERAEDVKIEKGFESNVIIRFPVFHTETFACKQYIITSACSMFGFK